jgi:uncharacterized protein (DUF2147 family)
MKFAKLFATLTFAAVSAVASTASAADLNPVGTWQSINGESRFAISYCGDGAQICAKLTWLREDARTPENVALLNEYVVQGAVETALNRWKGTVNYGGETITGSVTMVSSNELEVSGCKGIACQSLEFVRI